MAGKGLTRGRLAQRSATGYIVPILACDVIHGATDCVVRPVPFARSDRASKLDDAVAKSARTTGEEQSDSEESKADSKLHSTSNR